MVDIVLDMYSKDDCTNGLVPLCHVTLIGTAEDTLTIHSNLNSLPNIVSPIANTVTGNVSFERRGNINFSLIKEMKSLYLVAECNYHSLQLTN